jgi:hypothetical protein
MPNVFPVIRNHSPQKFYQINSHQFIFTYGRLWGFAFYLFGKEVKEGITLLLIFVLCNKPKINIQQHFANVRIENIYIVTWIKSSRLKITIQ